MVIQASLFLEYLHSVSVTACDACTKTLHGNIAAVENGWPPTAGWMKQSKDFASTSMSCMSDSREPVPSSPSICRCFSSSRPTSVVNTAMRSPDCSTAAGVHAGLSTCFTKLDSVSTGKSKPKQAMLPSASTCIAAESDVLLQANRLLVSV